MVSRRTLLELGGSAIGLSFLGTVTASAGDAQYLVRGSGGVARRVESSGFDIRYELADGAVLVVVGPEDAESELRSVAGVVDAVRDASFEVELPGPVESVGASVDGHESLDGILTENQWDKHRTNVAAAHELATGEGTTIAVLDTGVDHEHPDLAANVDESASRLFASLDSLQDNPWDVNGHGTHVAGIAAANGSVGVTGTAPDADVVSLRVFYLVETDDGPVLTTTTGDILAAIDYAASIGADAANLSIGTPPIPPSGNSEGYRPMYQTVIQHATRAGTLVVVSAGNASANLQQGGYFTVPNSVASAMSISATGPADGLSYYSNYGTNEIDVGAPGGLYSSLATSFCAIQEWLAAAEEGEEPPSLISNDPREAGETGTLWLDEDGVPTSDPDAIASTTECPIPEWPYPFNFVFSTLPGGEWGWIAGTSMAAPQVTGAAAVLRDANPGASPAQLEQAIEQSADGTDGKNDPSLGAGRLDVAGALEKL
ncbi:subtilisin-like serine protease [Salinarchaeum sp. Harcht-Bsk1]|uniref:S8 family peptidase n=1 Tax=Salinarchaeum sp. Harcht-Bsk1 TaxID=1333523 RepID=UPI0003423DC1|nr:S8 family serine peptidase [Salinarchaeum sp. Harcht-Bsk1]AGN00117.1 subtilisin-like serine protease [Salinarchaeum sp. Harcht-Bsk1]